jgi:hypothetical protein
MARAGRLFHTIVMVGVSTGCGSASGTEFSRVVEADAGSPQTGSTTAPRSPRDCAQTAQFHCVAPGDCSCDLSAPTSLCDCDRPGEFRCRACVSGPTVLGRCPNDDGVDCFCNKSIAQAATSDCASPAQLVCAPAPATYATGFLSSDWFQLAECSCDDTRPTSSSECSGQTHWYCQGRPPDCPVNYPAYLSSDAAFDCACLPPVPVIL